MITQYYLHGTKPRLIVVKAATFADVGALNGSRQQLHCSGGGGGRGRRSGGRIKREKEERERKKDKC